MTISYTLYLATDAKPEEATEALRPLVENPDVDTASQQLPSGMSWIPDGPVSITARPLNWRRGDAEADGVAAKLGVDFDLIAEESFEAKPVMLRDLLAILDRLPGDAVFHDVAGDIVLRRLAGKLELNLSCSFWTPELIALMPGTYTSRPFIRASFHAGLDPPWTSMDPVRLGRVPADPGAADRFVTVESDDGPLLRVDLYGKGDIYEEARFWTNLVAIGWGDHVYLVNVYTRKASTFDLGVYFQQLYPTQGCLLAASGRQVFGFAHDGSLLWRSDIVGLDGVIVERVEGDVIHGEGECDPPDGWRPFSLNLWTGQRLGAEGSDS